MSLEFYWLVLFEVVALSRSMGVAEGPSPAKFTFHKEWSSNFFELIQILATTAGLEFTIKFPFDVNLPLNLEH